MIRHEEIVVRRGRRTGATVIMAVHSTVLGPAIGGCRVRRYPSWQVGLEDALRLSEAMTWKASIAGLDHGGGKTVVVLPSVSVPREELLEDVAEVLESFGGRYLTGPDIGTGADDMQFLFDRTGYAFCRPAATGGSGACRHPCPRRRQSSPPHRRNHNPHRLRRTRHLTVCSAPGQALGMSL